MTPSEALRKHPVSTTAGREAKCPRHAAAIDSLAGVKQGPSTAATDRVPETGASQRARPSILHYAPRRDPLLPPEVWARIVECLPLTDMIRLGSVSRLFLREVSPLVEGHITVTDWRQMRPEAIARFKRVQSVDVLCLVTERFEKDEKGDTSFSQTLCEVTATSFLVPFLSQLPSLEYVWVGGRGDVEHGRETYRYWHCEDPTNHDVIFCNMIRDFCRAFREGKLPTNLETTGIVNHVSGPETTFFCEEGGQGCMLCRDICRSFPLKHVIKMDCKFAYEDENYSDYCREFDVHPGEHGALCISHAERLSIILSRPGGAELISDSDLLTKAFHRRLGAQFVRVDGTCTPSATGGHYARAIDLTVFDTLEEIQAIAECHVDVSDFDFAAVEKALNSSPYVWFRIKEKKKWFSSGDRKYGALRGKLCIMKESFDALLALGFPLERDDFRCVVSERREITLGSSFLDHVWEKVEELDLAKCEGYDLNFYIGE